MEQYELAKDTLVFESGTVAEMLFIVHTGRIELYTIMDSGTEMPLEYTMTGSVLNYRKFLIQDTIDISARASGKANNFFAITREAFEQIVIRDENVV
mmetsp:Transcript_81200/g.112455  ORF Transcript_81200/g.112455 Transcript_81200/m.112455 type:complete len:97 (+) Transcript_81200:1635-1925(+)